MRTGHGRSVFPSTVSVNQARMHPDYSPSLPPSRGAKTARKTVACSVLPFFLVLAGCAVGPDYVRPQIDVPVAYKEPGLWKTAEPGRLITISAGGKPMAIRC